MFWSSPKLPVTEEEKEWIEYSLQWLLNEFGEDYFLSRKIILPEPAFFPDKYRKTEECLAKVVARVCSYMDVDPKSIEVNVSHDEEDLGSRYRTGVNEGRSGAAGLYFPASKGSQKMRIFICASQLEKPTSLVATIAHELGHVILLGGGRLSGDCPDHEHLTDLITVFLGMGVFTANSSFQFYQWQDHSHQGWSASRLGYMSEEMFGYSLAACAWMRNEEKAAWAKHLSMNVAAFFKSSTRYLCSGGKTKLRKLIT